MSHDHVHPHEHVPSLEETSRTMQELNDAIMELVRQLRLTQEELNLSNMMNHILRTAVKKMLPEVNDSITVELAKHLNGPTGERLRTVTIFRAEDGDIDIRE